MCQFFYSFPNGWLCKHSQNTLASVLEINLKVLSEMLQCCQLWFDKVKIQSTYWLSFIGLKIWVNFRRMIKTLGCCSHHSYGTPFPKPEQVRLVSVGNRWEGNLWQIKRRKESIFRGDWENSKMCHKRVSNSDNRDPAQSLEKKCLV